MGDPTMCYPDRCAHLGSSKSVFCRRYTLLAKPGCWLCRQTRASRLVSRELCRCVGNRNCPADAAFAAPFILPQAAFAPLSEFEGLCPLAPSRSILRVSPPSSAFALLTLRAAPCMRVIPLPSNSTLTSHTPLLLARPRQKTLRQAQRLLLNEILLLYRYRHALLTRGINRSLQVLYRVVLISRETARAGLRGIQWQLDLPRTARCSFVWCRDGFR